MNFRKATKNDVNNILNIIDMAKEYLKSQDIDQWQNGYPNKEVIEEDIEKNIAYVSEIDGKISGYMAIVFENDPNYSEIFEGKWLSDKPYSTIHRIALDTSFRGQSLSAKMIEFAEKLTVEKGYPSMRIDTHNDNKVMQKLISKSGYIYCGIIYVADKTPRLAYERIIKNDNY